MLEFDFETYNGKYISIEEKASYKEKIDFHITKSRCEKTANEGGI